MVTSIESFFPLVEARQPLASLPANNQPSVSTPKPLSKKRAATDDANPNSSKRRSTGKNTTSDKFSVADQPMLPGEEDDEVEVYDSCDEIRRKINAHLRQNGGPTQAGMLRDFGAQYHPFKEMQSNSLRRFMELKGPDRGNMNCVFYGAYVYFEKLRIKQGKPKSKHRLEMEEAWSHQGGFEIMKPGNSRVRFLGTRNGYVYIDKVGRAIIVRRP